MRKDDVTDNERAENFWQAKYEDLRETTKNDQIEMMSLQKENDELRARVKQLASRIPGMMAAANKSITGISIIGPITTSIILGGIKIPKVPPAVIVPAANLTS